MLTASEFAADKVLMSMISSHKEVPDENVKKLKDADKLDSNQPQGASQERVVQASM